MAAASEERQDHEDDGLLGALRHRIRSHHRWRAHRASFGSEVRDVDPAIICAEVAWPWIPAVCLEGSAGEQVRYVTTDHVVNPREIDPRFVAAFE